MATDTHRCWRPGCTGDAPHELPTAGRPIRSCDRHLATARAVVGRPTEMQAALFNRTEAGAR